MRFQDYRSFSDSSQQVLTSLKAVTLNDAKTAQCLLKLQTAVEIVGSVGLDVTRERVEYTVE
jgi:hypothetical protein